jgi:hypothetical protein
MTASCDAPSGNPRNVRREPRNLQTTQQFGSTRLGTLEKEPQRDKGFVPNTLAAALWSKPCSRSTSGPWSGPAPSGMMSTPTAR